MTVADPKPTRVRMKKVYADFHAKDWRGCLHCGRHPVEAAHLLRGKLREDVLAGLIPLCAACHGAFDSRQKHYSHPSGALVLPQSVDRSVAAYLRSEKGEQAAAYLISVLGPFGAEAYVQKLEDRVPL